jgi:hypothetical protein
MGYIKDKCKSIQDKSIYIKKSTQIIRVIQRTETIFMITAASYILLSLLNKTPAFFLDLL